MSTIKEIFSTESWKHKTNKEEKPDLKVVDDTTTEFVPAQSASHLADAATHGAAAVDTAPQTVLPAPTSRAPEPHLPTKHDAEPEKVTHTHGVPTWALVVGGGLIATVATLVVVLLRKRK